MVHRIELPTIVITGSSSGIGRSTATYLAAHGFRVLAGVRRTDDAEVLRSESDAITPLMLDVTDPDSIQQAIETVELQCPHGIDGLVNNAGLAVAGPVELVSADQWRQQYDVNVLGMVNVTQSFLPMLRRRRGRIVNIGSAASSLALPMVGPYASSKFAVEGLSDSLRRELAPCGVKVIVVRPGQIATPIFDKTEEDTQLRMDSLADSTDHDYKPAMLRLQRLLHQSEKSRRSPDCVAKVVAKALTARRPKRRYQVGWDAHAAVVLERFVPSAMVDWVIQRQLRPDSESTE